MTAALLQSGKQSFRDNNGRPLAGGTVALYVPGTQTYKNSYVDPDLTVLNTNPISLDARGEALVYGEGDYRMVVKDATGVTIYDLVVPSLVTLTQLLANLVFVGADGKSHPIADLGKNNDAALGAKLVGYFPSWGGAFGRSVAEKLMESPSVDDFDGSTDKIKIQNACNYGGSIRFNRSYTFSDVQITKPVQIVGAGVFDGAGIWTNDTADTPFFRADTVSGIHITGFNATANKTKTSGSMFSFTNCNRVLVDKFFMQKYYLGIDFDGGSEIFFDQFCMFNGVPAANSGAFRLGNTKYTGSIGFDNAYIKNEDLTKQCSFGIQMKYVDVVGITPNVTIIGHGNDLHICPGNGQTAALINSMGAIYDTADNGIYISPAAGGKVIRSNFNAGWSGEHTQNCVVVDGSLGMVDGVIFDGQDIVHAVAAAGYNIFGANAKNIHILNQKNGGSTVGMRLSSNAEVYVRGGNIGAYGNAGGNTTGLVTDGTCTGTISEVDFSGNATAMSGALGALEFYDNKGVDNWLQYTTVVSSDGGSAPSATANVRFIKRNGQVIIEYSVVINTVGAATGALTIQLPFTTRITTSGYGQNISNRGMLTSYSNAGERVLHISASGGGFPAASGQTVVGTIIYETNQGAPTTAA